MKVDKANGGGAPNSRYMELKKMLDDRRRELQAEVQGKMRGVREEGERDVHARNVAP